MYVWIDGTNVHMRCKTRTMDFEPQKPEGKVFSSYTYICVQELSREIAFQH